MAALLPLVAIVGERHHLQCLLCGVRGHLLALILLPIRSCNQTTAFTHGFLPFVTSKPGVEMLKRAFVVCVILQAL
jgi:hypothetical protein